MPPSGLYIRGALIAAFAALALAIGLVAQQERVLAESADPGLASAVLSLRVVLALLATAFAGLGILLFNVTRRKASGPRPDPGVTELLAAATAATSPQDTIREMHFPLPSTEAGQMLAAGALGRRLAHELNNALSPIQGFADLMLNDPRLPEMQRRHAAKIAESTSEALGILRDFATALTWTNNRAASAHLGALVRSAAQIIEATLGLAVPVSIPSESDVRITATEAEAGQAMLHLAAAVTPLLAERDIRLEIEVDSLVGATEANTDDDGAAGQRLEIWSDPFVPEALKLQYGTLRASWRYGRVQFRVHGHGWSAAAAGRLFSEEPDADRDQAWLSMHVLGGLMLDLGGVVMIDTCPDRYLKVTLLWPARIASEVAAPLEVDTTEDDLDALIIHQLESAAEALSRRLGSFGLRVASTTSPEAGFDLIAEMGPRCRAVLIGETSDSGLRMKVVAMRPDALVLDLASGPADAGNSVEVWRVDPSRDELRRLAERLRRKPARSN